MGERHSIEEARSRLPQLVREAEAGNAVELTRRGKGVAVLIGRTQYQRLLARSRRFSEAWEDFSSEVDLAELDIDPAEVFAFVRIVDLVEVSDRTPEVLAKSRKE